MRVLNNKTRMLELLCEKRETHAQQLRRTDRERLIHQKRLKFLDMSELLNEADCISSSPSPSREQTFE